MKTLIIDDESYSADYVEMLCLEIPEIEISGKFCNALEALDFIATHPVDLVFMDIEMPGLTGIEAIHKMRELKKDLAVVFVTGYEQYALEAFQADAITYLLKPCDVMQLRKAVEKAKKLLPKEKKRVRIKTFGHFGLYIDGEPYRFSNYKAKELLALLVDREGSVVTMEQVVDLLWEDHPYNEAVKQLYRKAVIYLNKMMAEYNLDFFVSRRGSCHIIPSKIDCDYYELLNGAEEVKRQFPGEYMIDYSWGEETLARIERFVRIF